MISTIGFHTFTISRSISQETATSIFEDFKKYRDETGEIEIIGPIKYDIDPNGRHCEIVYPHKFKGITWKIRFSDRGFMVDGEYKSCSIKATINPKVLAGERTYIVAANAGYLEKVEKVFNLEAKKISPLLGKFHNYSLNRLDYCINFNVKELYPECSPELLEKLSEYIMELIKRADIPNYYTEEYRKEYQFYLKCRSMTINCYLKYYELYEKFPDCPDLEDSRYIIRFETQFKYPKVYSKSKKIKEQIADSHAMLTDKLTKQGFYKFYENENEIDRAAMFEELKEMSASKLILFKKIMSDSMCAEVIKYYVKRVIKPGDYFSFDVAKNIIESRVSKWEKVTRLVDTLKLIDQCSGISKAKATLQGKELENFRRSLRELAEIGVNPVVIPEEWGISQIPHLLDTYYNKIQNGNMPLTYGMKYEIENYNENKGYVNLFDS